MSYYLLKKRAIHFAALANIVGWVKRDVDTVFVGLADSKVSLQSVIASKLANPTTSVADHWPNPTYDLPLGLGIGYPFYQIKERWPKGPEF